MQHIATEGLSHTPTFQTTSTKQAPQRNFSGYLPSTTPASNMTLQERAITQLNDFDLYLEKRIPIFFIQKKADELGAFIEELFANLTPVTSWLQSNGQGAWYCQLLQFVCKLPLKAARNALQQLYFIMRGIVCGVIHPLKALNMVAKLLICLPSELIKPETWSKMGAGMVGTSLGQATIASNFLSLIAVGIGGAMIVAGVSIGTLKTALDAEKDNRLSACSDYIQKQAMELPETFVTSFYIGLIIGGIRKAVNNYQQKQRELEYTKSPDFYEVVKLCRTSPENYPPIAYAVKLGRQDVVKFLLDHNEAVNAATPSFDVYSDGGFEDTISSLAGKQPGYTALELAIRQNDAEMVKILLTHNPANFADPSLTTARFHEEFLSSGPKYIKWSWSGSTDGSTVMKISDSHPWTRWSIDSKGNFIDSHFLLKAGGPLAEALSGGNKEIIETVVKSLTTDEALIGAYEQIRALQQENLMRLWLKQKQFVLNGTHQGVADSTVQLFLKGSLQNAVASQDVSLVKELLLQPLSRYELELASKTAYEISAYEILELIEAKMK